MKAVGTFTKMLPVVVALFISILPTIAQADPGTNYCITPAFITSSIPPNLLLMIDNSTSMYDMAYADEGQKDANGNITRQPTYCYDESYKTNYCSGDTSRSCSQDSDCVVGQTCLNAYAGYFEPSTGYEYDFTNKYFFVPTTLPTSCDKYVANTLCVGFDTNTGLLNKFVARGNYLNWLAASKFDVEKKILTGGKYVTGLCSGNSNRACLSSTTDCASSQTCNAVTTPFLQAESRGCLGQGFIKDALTTDFVNFSSTQTDPNLANKLGIAFAVKGPEEVNPASPSQGGQTSIEIYQGDYNAKVCNDAITLWNTPNVNQTSLSNAVSACINYNTKATNYCQGDPARLVFATCISDADCTKPVAAVSGKCSNGGASCSSDLDCGTTVTPGKCSNTGASCTSDAVCAGTTTPGRCSNNASKTCLGPNDCTVLPISGNCKLGGGACTSDGNCAPANYCSVRTDKTCTTPGTACQGTWGTCMANTCSNPLPVAGSSGTCTNPSPTTVNPGTCSAPAPTTNTVGLCNSPAPVSGGTLNDGPCIDPSKSGVVKTKVAFTETINTCWQYIGKGTLGTGDFTRLTTGGKCTDVYAAYGVCSGDHSKGCGADTDCSGALGGSCLKGPAYILPGNPALVCSSDYLGGFYTGSAPTWDANSWTNDTGQVDAFKRYCNATQPSVIDPTDSAANTSNAEQLPALLGGIGLEGQLGPPKGKVLVRLKKATQPAGLLQEFGNRIRVGAMQFNFAGSATESSSTFGAVISTPKVCSNDPAKLCVMDVDCNGNTGTTYTCNPTTANTNNLDGASIIYDVGRGLCSASTTTVCHTAADCSSGERCYANRCWIPSTTECNTDNNCLSSQVCVSDGAGDHVTAKSLVSSIDLIRADSWTPFAEAYYNAIGYYATVKQCSNSTTSCFLDSDCSSGGLCNKVISSRTALRLNSNDYSGSRNPSQYRCQQNYVLLVSDGSSTADQNASSSSLADLYHVSAGKPATWVNTCPNYAGSKNLPILSWVARHLNISSFSLSTTPTATVCSGNSNQICSADTDCALGQTCLNIPRNGRDNISTYVVYNGGSNGLTDECSSLQLLSDTATNGGSTLQVASNPAQLSTALRNIFEELAAKAASGTAASILSNSEGSGANILQAVFYPKKIFNSETSAKWIGEMQNLWYYVDPKINNSTIREDTDYPGSGDHTLNLISDKVATFIFDQSTNQTMVQLQQDTNGDGIGDSAVTTVDPDAVKSIWRAGKQLWARDLTLSPRTIYTPLLSGGTEEGSTGLMKFTYGTIGSTSFPDNSTVLQPYLQMTDSASTLKLMKYIHGFDFPGDATMRPRTVKIGNIPAPTVGIDPTDPYVTNPRDKGIGVWKLGDIISSTPRIQSTGRQNTYDVQLPGGYGDTSYASFIKSNEYLSRGMVYVGVNDGMLHAFKLGILDVTATDFTKATLSGTDLGEEQWAFIPKSALPYLKYTTDKDYSHLYFVDGSTIILDASIGVYTSGTGSCTNATYDQCIKNPIVVDTATNNLDANKNTWRSILIGGMGLGGASSKASCTGLDCVQTPITDPGDTVNNPGLGYSSYFALDVTNPETPKLLWEFSGDPANNLNLGYATSGPAIVRIGDSTKNGKWFAVFGSGPTGPIDTDNRQFLGRSNQTLKFFILDLKTGTLVRTIDTGIANAFSGSLVGGPIDTDRWNALAAGRYQDDAIYVGYTKKVSGGDWTNGGVLRIMTKESANPADWEVTPVLDNIGPVTTAVARLQDRNNRALWLYFGTGRYYFRAGQIIDDYDSPRTIYGIKEPCYNSDANPGNFLDKTCTTARLVGDLTDQSTTLHTGPQPLGWKIDLDTSTTTFGAERVVTDTVALTNGAIFFTSFKPTADVCGFGGNSYLWALDYNSGLRPPDTTLTGKALIQLSTGEFKEVDLSTAFTDRGNRRMGSAMTGKPPGDAPPILSTSGNKPIKRILHIQER
ncbi:hypothetical protein AOG1_21510 [Geobacter sp. AOG1]|nr:hypothetical protein AOG1_21510 [Geobacter sp. AOG1]